MSRAEVAALPKIKVSALTTLAEQQRQAACAHTWRRIPLSTVLEFILVDHVCDSCGTFRAPKVGT